jgi:hypothetical protein
MKKRRRSRIEIPNYDYSRVIAKSKMTETQEMILGGIIFCTGITILVASVIILVVGSGAHQ